MYSIYFVFNEQAAQLFLGKTKKKNRRKKKRGGGGEREREKEKERKKKCKKFIICESPLNSKSSYGRH